MPDRPLHEDQELERIVDAARGALEMRTLCEARAGRDASFPVRAILLGNPAAQAAVGFFGGVHGLERIGTQVILSFLGSLVARMPEPALGPLLERVRLVFMPLVNPAGMWLGRRANGNGVDLMRNAPVQSAERVAYLVGGHRLSRLLPFYRGAAGAPMEEENRALCELVAAELASRPFSIALDCHSGFGLRDRIWFPHAHTRRPFARVAEVHALLARFDAFHPRHPYVFEPQSRQYLTHGDVWDYLCERCEPDRVFLPLTLEMGSWRWVRKFPRQALSLAGMFNPLPEDRRERVRRNHLAWLQYLCDAADTWAQWRPSGEERARHQRAALERWFGAR